MSRRLFQNAAFSREIFDLGDWFWSREALMLYFLSTESRRSLVGFCRACPDKNSLIEGIAVAGETMLRGAGRRGMSSRTATADAAAAPADCPEHPLWLGSATTHHCDCGCHRHRPDLDSATTTTTTGEGPLKEMSSAVTL